MSSTEEKVIAFQQLKTANIDKLKVDYNQFLQTIRNYPILNHALANAVTFFNTAMLWMEEGIRSVPLEAWEAKIKAEQEAKAAIEKFANEAKEQSPAPANDPTPDAA